MPLRLEPVRRQALRLNLDPKTELGDHADAGWDTPAPRQDRATVRRMREPAGPRAATAWPTPGGRRGPPICGPPPERADAAALATFDDTEIAYAQVNGSNTGGLAIMASS
jgi:hypothetical protein